MPATLLKNKKAEGPIHAFYLNLNANHSRLFLRSPEEAKSLQAKLEEHKITHSIESGKNFLEALAKAATTPERRAEIEREEGDLAKCEVIKIPGLSNLYKVARLLSHATISTQEFYDLLAVAVEQSVDPMADRQNILEKLASGARDSVTPQEIKDFFSVPSGPNVFVDFEGFLTQGIHSKELTFQQVHDLLMKNPHFRKSLNARSSEEKNRATTDPLLEQLSKQLKIALEESTAFLDLFAKTIDQSLG